MEMQQVDPFAQPGPEILPPISAENPVGDFSTASSSGTPNNSDGFDKLAADLLRESGDAPAGDPAAPGGSTPAADLAAGPAFADRWLARLSGDQAETIVRAHIETPFAFIAGAAKKPAIKLKEFEAELLTPPVAALLQRYIPLLLRNSSDPEWTAFFLTFGLYIVRVVGEECAEKIMLWVSSLMAGNNSSARATATVDSLASSQSSDKAEPEKPTGLSRIFDAASA